MHPLVHRATDLQVCPRPVGHQARPLTPNPQCQELTAHLLVCFNYFEEYNELKKAKIEMQKFLYLPTVVEIHLRKNYRGKFAFDQNS